MRGENGRESTSAAVQPVPPWTLPLSVVPPTLA